MTLSGKEQGQSNRSYRINSSEQQLGDVAVDRLDGEAGLGQEVGEVTALHLLATSNLLRLGRHPLVNVTLCWRDGD